MVSKNRQINIISEKQFKHFLSIIKNDHVSVTLTASVEFNGKPSIMFLKFFKPENTKSLVNEVTSYLLAKSLSLPIPKIAGIIKLPVAYFKSLEKMGVKTSSNKGHLTGFASGELKGSAVGLTFLNGANLDPLRKDLAKDQFAHSVIAFDDWVANIDRHLNNIIRTPNGNFKIFDHSHAITSPSWSASDLDSSKDYRNKLLEVMWNGKMSVKDASTIMLKIDSHHPSLGDSLPEITYWVTMLLTDEESRSLIDFISFRSKNRNCKFSNAVGLLDV